MRVWLISNTSGGSNGKRAVSVRYSENGKVRQAYLGVGDLRNPGESLEVIVKKIPELDLEILVGLFNADKSVREIP